MITLVRPVRVMQGKQEDATKWAIDIANYFNENYLGHNVQVYFERFGALGTIYWTTEYESLASLEAVEEKAAGDAKWAERVENTDDYWVSGSWRDKVLQRLV